MKVWCAGEMDVLPSVFSCSFSVFLWAAASANTYERKRCTAGGEENWRRKRRDEGDGEGVLVGPSVFSFVYVLSFCSSLLCSSSSVCFYDFLSRASPVSPSVFSVHPSSHSRPSCLYWEEMHGCCCYGWHAHGKRVRAGAYGCSRWEGDWFGRRWWSWFGEDGVGVHGMLVWVTTGAAEGGWDDWRWRVRLQMGRWVAASVKINLGLGFCITLNFFFVFKLLPCEFSPPFAYGWRFTYIENLYTCYLRKYCNNYCRDCLL